MTINHWALVLGATGGIGSEVAHLLIKRGWKVRALHRDPDGLSASQKASGLRWLRGDAMSAEDVNAAAAGVPRDNQGETAATIRVRKRRG